MVKIKELSINLDNNKSEFFAGETISGHVALEFVDQTAVIRIILAAEGIGISTTGRSCTERIYKHVITLFGNSHDNPNDNRPSIHPSGKHTYRFDILLPAELPSSVKEGSHGSIKYNLRAKIELNSGICSLFSSGDTKAKKPIKIKEIIDSNIPRYELQDVKTVRKIPSIFSNQKKLEKDDILIALSRAVCCPGETMDLNLQYKNVVAKKMGIVRVRLNKYVHFNKKDNKEPLKKMITEKTDEKYTREKIYQRTVSLTIPDNIVPTNTLTNAVVINYVLHVKVEGYKEIKLPIIIGTIPFEAIEDHILTAESFIPSSSFPRQAEITPSAPVMADTPYQASAISSSPPEYVIDYNQESAFQFQNEFENSPPSPFVNGAFNTSMDNFEIQCEFHHPPPYIPVDEFDLPPSYEEAITSSSANNQMQLVEAN